MDAAILSRASGMEAEILHEKASTLRRIGAGFEEALEALRAFDRSAERDDGEAREALVDAAAQALWYFVVQREVCGLGGTEQLLRQLGVPREVQLRMGVRKRAPGK